MSSAFIIRLPKKLKNDDKEIDDVDWQAETRVFLERKLRKERLARDLEVAKKQRDNFKKMVSNSDLIREDRKLAH